MNSLLTAALEHHSAGRAVLPVRENKAPHCGEGWNRWFKKTQSEGDVVSFSPMVRMVWR